MNNENKSIFENDAANNIVEEEIVLAVGGDELAQVLGPPHRLAHHCTVLHAAAVIRKGQDMGRKLSHCCKLLALLAHGDGPVGVDMAHGAAGDGIQLRLHMF